MSKIMLRRYVTVKGEECSVNFASVKCRILLGIVVPLLLMAGSVTGVTVWKMRATAIQDFTEKKLFGLCVDILPCLLHPRISGCYRCRQAPSFLDSYFWTHKGDVRQSLHGGAFLGVHDVLIVRQ